MRWSPRRVAELVAAPTDALEDVPLWAGAAVVIALCVLNAALASQAAAAVASATVGTTEVDNPDRPDEWLCDQADDEFYEEYRDACETEPETVTRSHAEPAREAANGLVPVAFLSTAATWLAVAGAFAVAMGGRSPDALGERVSYTRVLAVTGVGFAPAALRYAARAFAVEQSLADRALSPASLDGARRLAVDAMTPESTLYAAVVLVTVAWSAYAWRRGLHSAFDRAGVGVDAAVAFAAVLLLVQAVHPVYLGGGALAPGFVFLLLGLPALVAPRVLERIDLFFDLIGTRGDVELKPWRVLLEQLGGLAFVLAAAVAFGALALA
ncbi:hypothetical protein [Halobacterium yunchengense]|uniref:hypothetical protein n=1 Tax=Halobacterium yunchengense TaxID=3108497 RepID=UPI00300BD6F7